MKIGSVIVDKDGIQRVVVRIVNGVPETELLKDYIARIVVIEYKEERRTLREVIEMHCDLYLSNCEVIKIKQ